jgi:hypothetical protein
MKSIKGFALGLALGVVVAIGTVGLAQTTKPADQKQNAESCCAACCNHGGSDSMKTAEMKHEAGMKHDPAMMKAHNGEGACCCCGGDSCDMQMKTKMKENQE